MKSRTNSLLVAMLLALAMAPWTVAELHEGDDCAAYSQEDLSNGTNDTACKEATGPGGVTVKGAFGVGAAVCFLIEDVPFPCETAGVGGTFFNVTHWNSEAAAGDEVRHITIWTKHVDGNILLGPGYEITGCADRDYSGVCTNADDIDDFEIAYSNPAEQVNIDAPEEPEEAKHAEDANKVTKDPCDEKSTKDSKDCGDPTDARLDMCIRKNLEATQINGDGTTTTILPQWDQIVVFISIWVDFGLGGNIGDGTSTGTFEVWLDEGAFGGECPVPPAGPDANWQGAATVVVESIDGTVVVDQGVMECGGVSGNGQGGFCIHDNNVTAVYVKNTALNNTDQVAFQVCRDTDPIGGPGAGRFGVCTTTETRYSHGSDGGFVNPINVPGTPGTGQIVVFTCVGVHTEPPSQNTHWHKSIAGTGHIVSVGSDGYTEANGFCAPNPSVAGNVYFVR